MDLRSHGFQRIAMQISKVVQLCAVAISSSGMADAFGPVVAIYPEIMCNSIPVMTFEADFDRCVSLNAVQSVSQLSSSRFYISSLFRHYSNDKL